MVGFRPMAATSGPPISGPTSDAADAVAFTIASVRPRYVPGTDATSQASPAVHETAEKRPFTSRSASSSSNDDANAYSGAVAANSSVAPIVSRRAPRRSARCPAGSDRNSTATP